MKKILVTGGAGYIGSHTAHMLANLGYTVLAYDSLERGHKESLPAKAALVVGDLANTEKLEAVIKEFRPDAVMHFAAYAEAEESERHPQKYFENNTNNSIRLVKSMLKHRVDKLIFSSTAAVYGQPNKMPITEDTDKKPTNNYGQSKLLFEEYLNTCCDELDSVCLRYFNAAGAGYCIGEDHRPETHLIPLILKTAQGQLDKIKIYGTDYETPDGTCVRDYIHVLDLAEAHILALKVVEAGKSARYNLGTGTGNSVLEVIKTAEEVTGKRVPMELCERRKGDPAMLIASSRKIQRELGWKPRRSLKEIIESAWNWHSKNPKGF